MFSKKNLFLVDINECAEGSNNCTAGQICVNVFKYHVCLGPYNAAVVPGAGN